MKKIIDGKNPNTLHEVVPIQEFIDVTIEGIPQEVIDEIYDEFDEVIYDHYRKSPPKKPIVFVADYFIPIEHGEYKFQDEYWAERVIKGELLQRFNVVGDMKKSNTLVLTTVYSYNTIKENKK